MKQRKTEKLPKLHFRAETVPESFDEEKGTLEVVAASGKRGLRNAFFFSYYEELSMKRSAVRLDRLKSGNSPVLADHKNSIENVIGVVESARISDGVLKAKIRLSKDLSDPLVQKSVSKIKEGLVRNISIGYQVYTYEEVEKSELEEEGFKGADDAQVFRAVDWEPMEVSFVAVPFDDQANVRQRDAEESLTECEFILTRGAQEMKKVKKETRAKSEEELEEEKKAKRAEEDEEKKAKRAEEDKAEEKKKAKRAEEDEEEKAKRAEEDEEVEEEEEELEEQEEEDMNKSKKEQSAKYQKQGAELERARISAIQKACLRANVDESFGEDLIERGVGKSKAIEMIQSEWAKGGNEVRTTSIQVGEEKKRAHMHDGMLNAIMHRTNPKVELTEVGREYRSRTLLGLAEDCLEANGVKTRHMARSEVAAKALSRDLHVRAGLHGTGDFANLLLDAANKMLRQAYEFAPQSFRPFVRYVTAPDFKNINRIQLGEAPNLALVGEHGEIEYGTIGDSKEVYALASYGKAFALTRQALINDDLGGFERIPRSFGMAGANLESSLVYAILTGNPNMGDGNPLFDSGNHNNVGTGGPISSTTLTEMRKLGRLQYGLTNTTDPLNIQHQFLVVPAALETIVKQFLMFQLTPTQASEVNPFTGVYTPIIEPRLDANSATAWYGIANPSQIDTIEVCTLDGQAGVRIDSEVDFDTDGMKMKAMHDVATKAIDWRGIFKNAGV